MSSSSTDHQDPLESKRVWVIRGGERNRLVDVLTDAGATGVGYEEVPDATDITAAEVEALLAAGGRTSALGSWVSMMMAFVNDIEVGDAVLMPDTPRGEMLVGEITGGYEFQADVAADRFRHRRTVTWLARHPIADLPAEDEFVYRQRNTLAGYDSPTLAAHVERVRAGEIGRPPGDRKRVVTSRSTATTGRAAQPEMPKRLCPSCFMQKHPTQFVGDICTQCADQL